MSSAPIRWLLSSVLVAALYCASPLATAAAQEAEGVVQTPNPINADFKGMIGLGLIGAEIGFVVPALAGARDVWPYIVFPILGGGGGAVGGYYLLERGAGQPELAVGALTLGMAFMVPAMVITLAATAYDPETDEVRGARDPGTGLVRVSEEGGLSLAAPAIVTAPNVSQVESLRTGVPRKTDVSVQVVSGRF